MRWQNIDVPRITGEASLSACICVDPAMIVKKPHPLIKDKMITLIQIIPADGVRLFGQMVKKEIDLSDRGVGYISPLWP